MTLILNSKADLDHLKGTPEYDEALLMIAGASRYFINTAPAGEMTKWELRENANILSTFGLTKDALDTEMRKAGLLYPTLTPPADYVTTKPMTEKTEKRTPLEKLHAAGLTLEDLSELLHEAQAIMKRDPAKSKARGAN